jgi:hypothetical protein
LPSSFSVSSQGLVAQALAVDRHDVGMARQHDAAFAVGTDRSEQVGLGAFLVGHQRALHAVVVEVVANVMDQL